MPRYRSQPRAKRKIGAQKIQRGKSRVPGRYVVAPGYKPVRRKGKIVIKRVGPRRRSPVFKRGLPSPRSQVPARPKRNKSAPNPQKVFPSGRVGRSRRFVPGTFQYERTKLFSRSYGGDVYRALQREERRQEKLIKAITGRKQNVELRSTAQGVQRGVSQKRNPSALGAEPVATGRKGNKTMSLSTLNRMSPSKDVRKGQARIDDRRLVAKAQAKETKRLMNPQFLPYKGGPRAYSEPTTPFQRKMAGGVRKAKTPKVLRPAESLPKPRVKPYAYKQQRRQMKYAAREQAKTNQKNAKTLLNRGASLERRARAGDALSRAGVIQTETFKQFRTRRARERALARKRAERKKPLIDIKLDAGTFAKAGKAIAGFLTKNVRDAGDPAKIGDFGLVGKAGRATAKGAKAVVTTDVPENVGEAVGKAAVGVGASAVEPLVATLKKDRKNLVVTSSGITTQKAVTAGRVGELIWKVPAYSAEAIAKNPDEQLGRLAKDTIDMIKSVPAGVWMTFDKGPATVWEQIKDDYSRRYGPLLQGRDKEFRKRLEKEGVTAEVLDSLTALTIVGKGAGTALQGVAKSGRLGRKGSAFADEAQRIALRKPARDAEFRGVVDENVKKPSRSFFANVALRGVDTARGARARRESRLVQEGKREEVSYRTARADAIASEAGYGVPVRGLIQTKKASRRKLGGGKLVQVRGDAAVYAASRLRNKKVVSELGLRPADVRGLKNALDGGVTGAGLKLGKKNPGQSKVRVDLDLPETQISALEAILENRSAVVRVPDADAPAALAKRPTSAFGKLREDVRLGAEMPVVPKFFDSKFLGQSATIRRKVARIASAAFVQMRIEQREWEKQFGKSLRKLSEAEQQGFFYAQVFGIRTPEQARKFLGPHRDAIVRTREEMKQWETEADAIPGDLWAVFDEVPKIDELIKNADRVFTPRLAEFSDTMRGEARRLGTLDPGLRGGRTQMKMAEIGSQARMLGVRLEDYADDPINPTSAEMQDYIRDAEIARQNAGLEQAGFFRGEGVLKEEPQYSLYAVGGTKTVQTDKRKRFVLTDFGASNTDPQVFARGAMNNIKRRYNWNKTAELYAELADPVYRDMSPMRLRQAIQNGEFDENEVVLWSPGMMRDEESLIAREIAAAEREAPVDNIGLSNLRKRGSVRGGADIDVAQDGQARVHMAIQNSTIVPQGETSIKQLLTAKIQDAYLASPEPVSPDDFRRAKFTVIPRAAHDEIFDGTKPSGAGLRSVSVLQGKISRTILANPVWLQFQFASNAFLTGLVSGTGPVTLVKAYVWWKKLPDEVKRAVEPYVGIHRWYDEQNKIGASQFKFGPLNDLTNAWRGLKTTPFWEKGAQVNPLTAFFRADNAQNNFFRKAVLYNRVKREAYREMGEDTGMAIRLQNQLFDKLDPTSLGPEEQMRYLLSRRDLIEEHAQYVDSILGNWTTYTALERRALSRFFLFYGFLRFSLKLTFYTMPMKHPVTSEIMLKLGQLQHDELKRIFGSDIPPWEIGNYYTAGKKTRIEVARINPYFNLYQSMFGLTREQVREQLSDGGKADQKNRYELGPEFGGINLLAIFSYVPPYMAIVADQLYKSQSAFAAKPWTTNQDPAYKSAGLPWQGEGGVSLADRGQILWNQVLRLSPYYRALEQTGVPGRKPNEPFGPMRGKQTTDSTWFSPNPTEYSDRDVDGRRRIRYNQKIMRDQAKNPLDGITENIAVPFLGTDGRRKIESARRYEKEVAAKKGKKKKARRKSSSGALWTPSD